MSKRNSEFGRGTGCYTCIVCGKRTRETGEGESGSKLCLACWDREGAWNSHSDNHDTPDANCEWCIADQREAEGAR